MTIVAKGRDIFARYRDPLLWARLAVYGLLGGLLLGGVALGAQTGPRPEAIKWSKPARYERFRAAVRDKMVAAHIDPILINRAIYYIGDDSGIPPLVADTRSDIDRLRQRPSLAQQLLWQTQLRDFSMSLRSQFPIDEKRLFSQMASHSRAMTAQLYGAGEIDTDVDVLIGMTVTNIRGLARGIFRSDEPAGLTALHLEAQGARDAPLPNVLHWEAPIRIAATPRPERSYSACADSYKRPSAGCAN